jgi:chaperone modulatory protein CbpM
MRIELDEVLWFEEHSVTLVELSDLSALPLSLLQELVGGGAIVPLDAAANSEPKFGAQALTAARAARRLREDFELDSSGLLLALGLLDRVSQLEHELRALRARLPGPLAPH